MRAYTLIALGLVHFTRAHSRFAIDSSAALRCVIRS
jgi:hypothetical protein